MAAPGPRRSPSPDDGATIKAEWHWLTRQRDKNGEISRKHGNTLIRTLRKTYGPGFASGR